MLIEYKQNLGSKGKCIMFNQKIYWLDNVNYRICLFRIQKYIRTIRPKQAKHRSIKIEKYRIKVKWMSIKIISFKTDDWIKNYGRRSRNHVKIGRKQLTKNIKVKTKEPRLEYIASLCKFQ